MSLPSRIFESPVPSNNDVIYSIISGVSTTAALIYYIRNRRHKAEIERLLRLSDKLELEIKYLETENASAKLNPHLLKNTLNAIYSYSWQTTHAIEKLSEMLKYILNENKRKYVPLHEELAFLKAYYQVHKMKLSPQTKDKFTLNISAESGGLKIAPLLTVNFIENAFVHGDYTNSDSFLDLHITVTQNQLIYCVKNSYSRSSGSTGLGNQNFRKRLDLLHHGKHELVLTQDSRMYTATLKLQLHEH